MAYIVWHGERYDFVEVLEDFAGEAYVICAHVPTGARRCLPKASWDALAKASSAGSSGTTSAASSAPSTPSASSASSAPTSLTARSPVAEKIALFRELFAGCGQYYATSYIDKKTGKIAYSPACANKWVKPLCKFPCSTCKNRAPLVPSDTVIERHLRGQLTDGTDAIGIYPMLPGNTTAFLAADFDDDNWHREAHAYCQAAESLDVPCYLERSRSGEGGHAWIFFASPIPAKKARALGFYLITVAMERFYPLPFRAYDRFFPAQDAILEGGIGNQIALPLQGQPRQRGNSVFVNETLHPYPDQWAFLSRVQRIAESTVDEILPADTEDTLGNLLRTTPETTKRRAAAHNAPEQDTIFQPATSPHLTSDLHVRSSNVLAVNTVGLTASEINEIRRLAAFANPEYYRAVARRQYTGKIPRVIYGGVDTSTSVGLPRGCRDNLEALARKRDAGIIWDDARTKGRTIRVAFTGTLRPEQEAAASALLANENGILSAATGFGKTVVGARLIAERSVNTLVLVPSTALLDQWRERLTQFLDIDEEPPQALTPTGRKSRKQIPVVGQIGGGKFLRSGIIDVAIPASLFEKGDIPGERRVMDIVSEYGMVICDECHHAASFNYEQVLKAAKATYVYGMTATPARQDGLEPIMLMQCGPVRYTFSGKDQEQLQSFARVLVPRFTRFTLSDDEREKESSFTQLLEIVCDDADRNALIADDVAKLVRDERTPLVLTRRIKHAEVLYGMLLRLGIDAILMVGSDDAQTKKRKFAELAAKEDGDDFAVVATGDYLGEGFDDARFDALVLAAPISWKGLVVQYSGRLHREHAGKTDVVVYDYVDARVPTLDAMYRKRLKEYGELGYQAALPDATDNAAVFYAGEGHAKRFADDIAAAVSSVEVSASYLNEKKLALMESALREAVERGVTVKVALRVEDTEGAFYEEFVRGVALLEHCGCAVEQTAEKQRNLTIIDGRIVWYGDISVLGFNKRDTQALRFESASVAQDLRSTTKTSKDDEE